MNLFNKKYRIWCNRWTIDMGKDGLKISNDETFPTQHTGNSNGRLQARCYKLLKKYNLLHDNYGYHFYIENNKQEKDVRKM